MGARFKSENNRDSNLYIICHANYVGSSSLTSASANIKTHPDGWVLLAEAEGFEPPWGFPQTVFKNFREFPK